MDILNRLIGIIGQPAIFWSLVAFTLIMVSYSIYGLVRDYGRIADLKKKKKEAETELTNIEAKLEDLKKKLERGKGK